MKQLNMSLRVLSTLWIFTAATINAQPGETGIEDFAFLTGYWSGTGMGGKSEEMWMPPSDGRMFGIFKQSNESGLIFTEFMEITQADGEFVLRLKHFNPDFSGWEEKTEHLTFSLEGSSENSADFGSLRYKVNATDALQIELDMRQQAGTVKTEIFILNRVRN